MRTGVLFALAFFGAAITSAAFANDQLSTTLEIGGASVGAAVAHRVISNRAHNTDAFLYFAEIRVKDDEKVLSYLEGKLKDPLKHRIRFYEKEIAYYAKDLLEAKANVVKYEAVKLLERRLNPLLFTGAVAGAVFTAGEIVSGDHLIEGTSNLLEKVKAPSRPSSEDASSQSAKPLY